MVGWAPFRYRMKLSRLCWEPGQMHRMSSMYLFHRMGSVVEFLMQPFLQFCHEEVGIGGSHLGPIAVPCTWWYMESLN